MVLLKLIGDVSIIVHVTSTVAADTKTQHQAVFILTDRGRPRTSVRTKVIRVIHIYKQKNVKNPQ